MFNELFYGCKYIAHAFYPFDYNLVSKQIDIYPIYDLVSKNSARKKKFIHEMKFNIVNYFSVRFLQ